MLLRFAPGPSCRHQCRGSQQGRARPIPPCRQVCRCDSGHQDLLISTQEVEAKLKELAGRETRQPLASWQQAGDHAQETGDAVLATMFSSRTARNKVRAAELRAAALGLSQEDFTIKLQELSLLLPGMSRAQLMTAPSLDAELLLELCLSTATVADRVIELRSKVPDADVSRIIQQQPELLTDRHWRSRYLPRAVLSGHSGAVTAVAVSPDGRCAASGSTDGGDSVRLWSLPARSCVGSFRGHVGGVTALAITRDGGRAVSGGADGTLRILDLVALQCVATLPCRGAPVTCLALTPDGRFAVSGSSDKALYVHDLHERVCVATLWGHAAGVTAVALAPDGRHAVSGSSDGTLRVWDLREHTCVASLGGRAAGRAAGTGGHVSSIAITPDGRHAVAGLSDSSMHVYDLRSRARLDTPQPPAREISGVAVTPDGRHVVLASGDDGLALFDLRDHQFSPALPGYVHGALALALTADGRWAVAGGRDHSVCVWERGGGPCEASETRC